MWSGRKNKPFTVCLQNQGNILIFLNITTTYAVKAVSKGSGIERGSGIHDIIHAEIVPYVAGHHLAI